MRTFRGVMLLATVPLLCSPALSKDDPMETQRCIWRCMADTPGWDGRNFKAYEACTRRFCGEAKRSSKRRRS